MRKKLLTLIIGMALLIAALPLAAAAEGEASQSKAEPAVGGQLNLLLSGDPSSFHPLRGEVLGNIAGRQALDDPSAEGRPVR